MPTTYHRSKYELAEACWAKLKEAGAVQELIACVSEEALIKRNLVAYPTEKDYRELLEVVIALSWKSGFEDALIAIEAGAVGGLEPFKSN